MSVDVAGGTPERKELTLPRDVKQLTLIGIFGLMLFAALYLTGEIVVPILLAFVLNMVLQPFMQFLVGWHFPRFIAALLIVLLLLGAFVGLAFMLAAPAAEWMAKAPESVSRLEKRLSGLTALAKRIQKAGHDVEKISDDPSAPPPVSVKGPALSTFLLSGTRAAVTGALTTVLLLFFLLVMGNQFLRRTVEILPRLRDKKQAVDISYEIQHTVSTYLGTVTVMNGAVGVLTGAAAYFCGLGDPLLWGAVAFLLNFVPIIGPLICAVVIALAGLLTFDTLWMGLLPAGIYLVIHLIEGESITPMLLARQFTLNPVLVIMSLVFWYWMWGVMGALLAVPMLATFKIVCDRIQPLMALGHFLGTEGREVSSTPQ